MILPISARIAAARYPGGEVACAVSTFKAVPRPVRWSFLLFIFTIPFQGLDLPVITSELFSLSKVSGFLFFACYVFYLGLPLRKPALGIPTAMWLFLMYFALYIASGFFIREEGLRQYVMRMLTLIQLIVFFWLAADLMRREKLAKSCLLTLAVASAITAIGGLLNLPGFVSDAAARARVLDENPNYTGILMAYAGVIFIGLCLIETGWSAVRKCCLLALTVPTLALLVSTASRAALGSFAIGLSVFFFPYHGSKRQMLAFVLGLLTLLGVISLTMRQEQAALRWAQFIEHGQTAGRDEIYSTTLEMISERPIFGWGASMANTELGSRLGLLRDRAAHNLILHLLMEVGIVGTVPFIVALVLCGRAAWRARTGPLGLIPLGLFMTFLANSVTHTSLTQKPTWLVFALTLSALAAALSKRDPRWAILGREGRLRLALGARVHNGSRPVVQH